MTSRAKPSIAVRYSRGPSWPSPGWVVFLLLMLLMACAAQAATHVRQALLSPTPVPCALEAELARMQAYLDFWLYDTLQELDQRQVARYRARLATDASPQQTLRQQLRQAQVRLRTDTRQRDRALQRLRDLTGITLQGSPPAPPDPRGYLPVTLGAARQGFQAHPCHATVVDEPPSAPAIPLDSSWHQYQALSRRLEEIRDTTDSADPVDEERQRQALQLRRNRLEHAIRILLLTGRLNAYVQDIGRIADAWPAQISRVAPPPSLPHLPSGNDR